MVDVRNRKRAAYLAVCGGAAGAPDALAETETEPEVFFSEVEGDGMSDGPAHYHLSCSGRALTWFGVEWVGDRERHGYRVLIGVGALDGRDPGATGGYGAAYDVTETVFEPEGGEPRTRATRVRVRDAILSGDYDPILRHESPLSEADGGGNVLGLDAPRLRGRAFFTAPSSKQKLWFRDAYASITVTEEPSSDSGAASAAVAATASAATPGTPPVEASAVSTRPPRTWVRRIVSQIMTATPDSAAATAAAEAAAPAPNVTPAGSAGAGSAPVADDPDELTPPTDDCDAPECGGDTISEGFTRDDDDLIEDEFSSDPAVRRVIAREVLRALEKVTLPAATATGPSGLWRCFKRRLQDTFVLELPVPQAALGPTIGPQSFLLVVQGCEPLTAEVAALVEAAGADAGSLESLRRARSAKLAGSAHWPLFPPSRKAKVAWYEADRKSWLNVAVGCLLEEPVLAWERAACGRHMFAELPPLSSPEDEQAWVSLTTARIRDALKAGQQVAVDRLLGALHAVRGGGGVQPPPGTFDAQPHHDAWQRYLITTFRGVWRRRGVAAYGGEALPLEAAPAVLQPQVSPDGRKATLILSTIGSMGLHFAEYGAREYRATLGVFDVVPVGEGGAPSEAPWGVFAPAMLDPSVGIADREFDRAARAPAAYCAGAESPPPDAAPSRRNAHVSPAAATAEAHAAMLEHVTYFGGPLLCTPRGYLSSRSLVRTALRIVRRYPATGIVAIPPALDIFAARSRVAWTPAQLAAAAGLLQAPAPTSGPSRAVASAGIPLLHPAAALASLLMPGSIGDLVQTASPSLLAAVLAPPEFAGRLWPDIARRYVSLTGFNPAAALATAPEGLDSGSAIRNGELRVINASPLLAAILGLGSPAVLEPLLRAYSALGGDPALLVRRSHALQHISWKNARDMQVAYAAACAALSGSRAPPLDFDATNRLVSASLFEVALADSQRHSSIECALALLLWARATAAAEPTRASFVSLPDAPGALAAFAAVAAAEREVAAAVSELDSAAGAAGGPAVAARAAAVQQRVPRAHSVLHDAVLAAKMAPWPVFDSYIPEHAVTHLASGGCRGASCETGDLNVQALEMRQRALDIWSTLTWSRFQVRLQSGRSPIGFDSIHFCRCRTERYLAATAELALLTRPANRSTAQVSQVRAFSSSRMVLCRHVDTTATATTTT